MIPDRIPPQNIELEQAVLGSIMILPNSLINVSDFLIPEIFYLPKHQEICQVILELSNQNTPIDFFTVSEKLKKGRKLQENGGELYFIDLCEKAGNGLDVEHHGRKLQELFIQRKLIEFAAGITNDAFSGNDVFDLLEKAESSLIEISSGLIRSSGQNLSFLLSTEMKELKARSNSNKRLVGIGSGFPELDRVTHGFIPQNFYVIAARPSMGKTAFGLIIARNASISFNIPTAFFSLEMSASQLTQRLLASESKTYFSKIQTGDCQTEFETIFTTAGNLSNANLFIDDQATLSIFQLRSKARKLKMKHGIGLVIVDYLQLMKGEKDRNTNREQEISSISRGLKSLSKELNIPVIALAQLSRECEKRADKRPILSDLRESGSIEQDADLVSFLYRPAYYHETGPGGNEYPENVLELNIQKHRNGAITSHPIILRFDREIVKISSMERDYENTESDRPF